MKQLKMFDDFICSHPIYTKIFDDKTMDKLASLGAMCWREEIKRLNFESSHRRRNEN